MSSLPAIKNIEVERLVFEQLTPFQLGILQAEVHNAETGKALLAAVSDQCTMLAQKLSIDEVRELEQIKSIRKVYKHLGNDPNRYRPAADALLRRIVKGNGLYSISAVVDVLNLISIWYGISISGFDEEKIEGTIQLGKGKENEPYEGIGRGLLNIVNLPVLRDNAGAFGNPTSDSVRTAITLTTTQTLFVYYDFGNSSDLQTILDETILLLSNFAGGKAFKTKIQKV